MSFASVLKVANTVLSTVTTAVAVAVMAFSGYMIYENAYVQNRAYAAQYIDYKPVTQGNVISIEAPLENIPDFVGWVTMDDTHIDYPVVQGEDDLYYVNRDVYKNPSLSGSIYLQAKNKSDFSDTYNLLYGHHMDNGAMFGDLTMYLNKEFFDSHLTGTLVTTKEEYTLDVVSSIRTDAYEPAVYDRTSMDWDGYVKTILNNDNIEVVNTNPAITSADKFLVLSTCEGVSTDGRILLICRMVKTEKSVEPTPDPSVVTPTPRAPIVKTGDPRYESASWAFLNLCCLILTLIAVLPYIFNIGNKEDEETRNRNYFGPIINVILAIVALVIFMTYENMKLPMAMRDRYTPWMLIILALALVCEEICTRKKKVKAEEEDGKEDINA